VSAERIPEDVRRFLGEYVDSAEKLEILLFLHRNPGRGWTAEELSPMVYTVPAAALQRLEALAADGLVSTTGGGNPTYRFQPADERLRERVDALAAAYGRNRVGVIRAVLAIPKSPAQSFADAFRLRRDV